MIILWQQEYYHVPVALTFTHSFLLDACRAGDVRIGPSTVTLRTRTWKQKTWHEKLKALRAFEDELWRAEAGTHSSPPTALAALSPFASKRADNISSPKRLFCPAANSLSSGTTPQQCRWCLWANVKHKSSRIHCVFLISGTVLKINERLYCTKAASLQGEELNNCYWKWLGQH